MLWLWYRATYAGHVRHVVVEHGKRSLCGLMPVGGWMLDLTCQHYCKRCERRIARKLKLAHAKNAKLDLR